MQSNTPVLPPQLFNLNVQQQSSALQFQPTAQITFTDPNNQGQLLASSAGPGGGSLLLQHQQQLTGLNFIPDALGTLMGSAQAPVTMVTPMSVTTLGGVAFASQPQAAPQNQSKQRVFTGTVTKIHDNFGFIDEEVFFQMGAVKGPILPKEGDRVLVEADYNPSMPFKWNATRVQIVNMGGGLSNHGNMNMNLGGVSAPNQQFPYPGKSVYVSSSQSSQPPPPPIISHSHNRNSQPVGIVSNPHSIYSGPGPGNPGMMKAPNKPHPIPPLQQQRRPQLPHPLPQGPPMLGMDMDGGNFHQMPMPPQMGIPPLLHHEMDHRDMNKIDRDMDRDRPGPRDGDRPWDPPLHRERMDRVMIRERSRSRERIRLRSRSRERERDRSKERDRGRIRERSPERIRKREKDLEEKIRRERRKRSSPSPKRIEHREREDKKKRDKELDKRDKIRDRSPSPNRLRDRKRSRSRESLRSVETRRSKSPPKPAARITNKGYSVHPPQFPIDLQDLSAYEVRRRYKNLYVPSEFFLAKACWMTSFTIDRPLDLGPAAPAHIFNKSVERVDVKFPSTDNGPMGQQRKSPSDVLEPQDGNSLFQAKVILLTSVGKAELMKQSCTLAEDDIESKREYIHRLITFVVGTRTVKDRKDGVNGVAIGGPWSASLDGENPHSDPKVLVNTAIRYAKALTGLDLSRCQNWYRFMELYYRRSNGNLWTVVYFIPDIWTCLPTPAEWNFVKQAYHTALYGKALPSQTILKDSDSGDKEGRPATATIGGDSSSTPSTPAGGNDAEVQPERPPKLATIKVEPMDTDEQKEAESETQGDHARLVANAVIKQEVAENANYPTPTSIPVSNEEPPGENENTKVNNDNCNSQVSSGTHPDEEDSLAAGFEATDSESLKIGTHYSKLDPKTMNVAKLKAELIVRGLSSKGLKQQLTARLLKVLKDEQDDETGKQAKESSTTETLGVESGSGLLGEKVPSDSPDDQGNHDTMDDSAFLNGTVGEGSEAGCGTSTAVITSNMSAAEKKIWQRRYGLPKSPKLLIHPSPTAKNGEFECVPITLANIRDYRVADRKEEEFELFMFGEFFYEMLQRDFGFRIYKEFLWRSSQETKADENGDSKKDDKLIRDDDSASDIASEPQPKRRKSSSVSLGMKMKTVNPDLLFAFVFFDQTQCGYIKQIDLEELFLTLGLSLSRAQVRKMLQKICGTGDLQYRKWTDKQVDDLTNETIEFHPEVDMATIGNKSLLPVFTFSESPPSLLGQGESTASTDEAVTVTINGNTVNVTQLQLQLNQSLRDKSAAEATVNVLKNNLNDAKSQISDLKKSNETLKEDLTKAKGAIRQLESTEKSNKVDLQTLRHAAELFCERVKDVIKDKKRDVSSKKSKD